MMTPLRRSPRKILGIDTERPAYLIAFSELDLGESALRHVEQIPDAVFLFKHPLHYSLSNGLCLDAFDLSYPDVIAAVNAVITKPGYGIASDCLAHGTPMIYTDRGTFAEYPVIVETLQEHLRTAFIPAEDLYSGKWGEAIREIQQASPRHSPIRTDGADICAQAILDRLMRPGAKGL